MAIINDYFEVSLKMAKIRYLAQAIEKLCFTTHKMAFVSGPRQAGKTTMAKYLLDQRQEGAYFNWDEKGFRHAWTRHPLQVIQATLNHAQTVPLDILDEIHKARHWKRELKGVYDTLPEPVDILVTGSARLNIYRRGSDSLLGRYHHFRLHPFSVAELMENQLTCSDTTLITALNERINTPNTTAQYLDALWQFGPFPQPLFQAKQDELRLWQLERVERLVREDLRDLSRIQDLSQIEMLTAMLPERAAGMLSITALREDLEVSHATMKNWLQYLQEIYYIFEIKPYMHRLPRSIKKAGKVYLYDWSEIRNEGARFENLIASHLLKYTHYLTDTGACKAELRYLKNKEKQEIDFLLVKDHTPWLPIEVKYQDTTVSKHWVYYFSHLPCRMGIQIVKQTDIYKWVQVGEGQVLVISADAFLSYLV